MSAPLWFSAVVRRRVPLCPVPSGVRPRLSPIAGIRAVIFDIYGTLIISGSGDVGGGDVGGGDVDGGDVDGGFIGRVSLIDDGDEREVGVGGGLRPAIPVTAATAEAFRSEVAAFHAATSLPPGERAEVDALEVWRRLLASRGRGDLATDPWSVAELAAEFESRTNPTWPMPGAAVALEALAGRPLALGIVSNAQAFTLPLIEDLVGGPLSSSAFDLDLCLFSYRYRRAKPSPSLFRTLRAALRRRGISASEAVYVGNDMLNDVWAAGRAGLRTVWFAGDRRSCRPREDDPRCRSLRPDAVITEWGQFLQIID